MICVAPGWSLTGQHQDELETRIERLFLSLHGIEIGELEALAPRPALGDALLQMVVK